MKLSNKKKTELLLLEYFTLDAWDEIERTDEEIEEYFEWSEHGLRKEKLVQPKSKLERRTYFHVLMSGKRWAGIHM